MSIKRLSLYVFYNKDGIVNDYVIYYLNSLKKISTEIIVIINGKITEAGQDKLNKHNINYIIRENKGYDFGAWKYAINHIGLYNIKDYDELILCNCSCYGPIYPFSEMFNHMKNKKCDFWGIYEYPQIKGITHKHLQSYFLVIKNNVFSHKSFSDYWNNLTYAKTLDEAIIQEIEFTNYFNRHGFIHSYYIDSAHKELIGNPTIFIPDILIKEYRMPFLKRKALSLNYEKYLNYCDGSHIKNTIQFIKEYTQYPIDLIFNDIILSMQNSSIRTILHNTYIINDDNKK